MHWTYADLLALPAEVYDVLLQMLNDEAKTDRDRQDDLTWR